MSDLSKLKIGLILSIAVLCSGCVSQETPVYEGSVTADIYYVGSQFEDNPLLSSLERNQYENQNVDLRPRRIESLNRYEQESFNPELGIIRIEEYYELKEQGFIQNYTILTGFQTYSETGKLSLYSKYSIQTSELRDSSIAVDRALSTPNLMMYEVLSSRYDIPASDLNILYQSENRQHLLRDDRSDTALLESNTEFEEIIDVKKEFENRYNTVPSKSTIIVQKDAVRSNRSYYNKIIESLEYSDQKVSQNLEEIGRQINTDETKLNEWLNKHDGIKNHHEIDQNTFKANRVLWNLRSDLTENQNNEDYRNYYSDR